MDTAGQLRKANNEREHWSLVESKITTIGCPSLKKIRVERLKLIVLDGTVDDIEDSIGRLQISGVSIDRDTR